MTTITLGIDELKKLITEAVSAGVAVALKREQQPETDPFMSVLATQGPYAAQQWQKNQMKRRRAA